MNGNDQLAWEARARTRQAIVSGLAGLLLVAAPVRAATTVTTIPNYLPLEEPAGGPNFFRFGDDVVYQVRIANNGP